MASNHNQRAIDIQAKALLCDFFTVAIHSILHSRKVYNEGVFKPRQKFNMAIQICFHPDVFNYVTDLVSSIQQLMDRNQLNAVHIVISSSGRDVEEILMRFHSLKPIATSEELARLDKELRSCLLKLLIIDTYGSAEATPDKTWRVEIESQDSLEKSNRWLESAEEISAGKSIFPLRLVNTQSSIRMEVNYHKLK